MIFRCFLFVYMFVFLQSCSYDKAEEIKPTPLKPGGDTTKVTYKITILPILEKNCYRCHTPTSTDPNKNTYLFLNDFNSLREYALKTSVSNASYTTLQARIRGIESPGMPFDGPKLSELDIIKIEAWIKEGAPKN